MTTLHRSYPAVGGSVAQARLELAALADRAGATQEQLDRILLATSEALTNVVEHAYAEVGGAIEVCAAQAGGDFCVIVADRGRGLRCDHSSDGLGVGFPLMRIECDALTLASRAGGGFEVRMSFAIGEHRPPREGLQLRGSLASASSAASPRFSTTT